MSRLPQHFDNASHRSATGNRFGLGPIIRPLNAHEFMCRLRADRNGYAAHNRPIVALCDVVADTVRHRTTAFLDNKNPRCQVRRVPRMLSDGGR